MSMIVDQYRVPRTIGIDKRIKLTEVDKQQILNLYNDGVLSQRKLALLYNVSRRTIAFIIDPTKKERCKEQFKERQADGRYYNKDKNRIYQQKHREHKKELLEKGLLLKKEC